MMPTGRPSPGSIPEGRFPWENAPKGRVDTDGLVWNRRPEDVRFSQTTVSYKKKRIENGKEITYTYDDIKENMYNNGWPQNQIIDIIRMPDGKLTSIDNTRLTAAREQIVDKNGNPIMVRARYRLADEPLSMSERERFSYKRKEPFPETWGEAIQERIKHQRRVPSGEEHGLKNMPKITGRPNQ